MPADKAKRINNALHTLCKEIDCTIYEILEELEGNLLSEEEISKIIKLN